MDNAFLHSSLQLKRRLSRVHDFVAVIHRARLQEERNRRFLIQRVQRLPLKMRDFRDTEDDLTKARRIRCTSVSYLTDDPVDLRMVRVDDNAREGTIVMEPVGKERQILNMEFTMDGQNALIGVFCSHGKRDQRSLGNVVRARKRIGQCQEKTRIIRKDSQFDLVREETLVLYGIIVLLVRKGSVREIHTWIKKGLEVVDGLHVRRADMVDAATGRDDQSDLAVRDGLVGNEMHGGAWRRHCLGGGVVFSIFYCAVFP